jgi:hypothetical protein
MPKQTRSLWPVVAPAIAVSVVLTAYVVYEGNASQGVPLRAPGQDAQAVIIPSGNARDAANAFLQDVNDTAKDTVLPQSSPEGFADITLDTVFRQPE